MKLFLEEELKALEDKGLRRSLKEVTSAQGREIIVDGCRVLNFCSNDYLGLANDKRLVDAAALAMKERGFGAGAARLVCGNFDVHDALEENLAQIKHTPAALIFNTGYMANVGIISALVGREDAIFSDKLNHASLLDGMMLSRAKVYRYPHRDMNALERMLSDSKGARHRLIVTDTVFSMDGDVAPLKDIVALGLKYDAWVFVDEAHAFGVLGPTGAGLVEALGVGDHIHVQMGTLSKAVGTIGAYAAGSLELKNFLLQKARSSMFTTAMPPLTAAASLAALNIMLDEPWRRERVLSLSMRMREGLQELGFDTGDSATPIIPVMIKDSSAAQTMSQQLFKQGIFVAAIRPPTVPVGSARLRVTVTAAHTPEDVDRCLEAFRHAV